MEDLLRKLGVPGRYLNCTHETWKPMAKGDPWPHLERWMNYADRPWCVVFLGPTGCGKTHLATALLREWISRCGGRTTCWWIDAASAINQLRDEVQRDPSAYGRTMREKLHDERLILLDDFLADRLTDFAHDEWVYALSQRYNHMRPTIITCNAEDLESFDALDPRITSRLSSGLVIRLAGKDWRGLRSVAAEATT